MYEFGHERLDQSKRQGPLDQAYCTGQLKLWIDPTISFDETEPVMNTSNSNLTQSPHSS